MELTKEQVEFVAQYLDKKGVFYLDVRIEMLDHIISDIENNMHNGVEFKDAFIETVNKCKPLLMQDSSIFLGYSYSKPKVIIDKMKKIIKPHAFTMWGLLLLLFVSIAYKFNVPVPYSNLINSIAVSLIYILSILIGLGYLHIRISKQKTSYRFLYETQVLAFSLFPLMLFGDFITKNGNIDFVKMLILVFGFFVFKLGYRTYSKHFETVDKYINKWN